MASGSPKSKNPKMDGAKSRATIAKPILAPEFTEDPPLQEVYVGLVREKKDISTMIQSISNVLPCFHHLKRCSSNRLLLAPIHSRALFHRTEETCEKDILNEEQCKSCVKEKDFNLTLPNDNSSSEDVLTEQELKSYLKRKGFNLSLLEDSFQVYKVPARAPRTKAQAARASKIWPVNFHPDPNLESLMDGSIFETRQYESIENYMRVVIEAARSEAIGNVDCNGAAIIVDPEDGRILAIAASKIDRHPMWHAAMLAVDLVASLQGGGAWKLQEQIQTDSKPNTLQDSIERDLKRNYNEATPLCYPKTLSNISLPIQESLKPRNVRSGRRNNTTINVETKSSTVSIESMDIEKCGPYLCTGYWVFLLKEPCPLCAMALLHSRVLRIFYGVSNQRTGVLGSKGILHAVPGLNHRYQVWSGILEEKCEEVSEEIEHKIVR